MTLEEFTNRPMAAHPGMLGLFANSLRTGLRARSADTVGETAVVEGVALIDISGLLTRGASYAGTTYPQIKALFAHAAADPAIIGIVLAVDSLGAELTDLFETANYIYSLRDSKPIYAVADPSFSGSYLLASAASKVYVTCTGGTGSLGIVVAHVNTSQSLQNQGITVSLIHSGSKKIWGNSVSALDPGARAELQAECDRLRNMLCDAVARNRNTSVKTILDTEAQCYFGSGGVKAGLADAVGTIDDAVADILATSGVTARSSRYRQTERLKNKLVAMGGRSTLTPAEGRRRIRALEGLN